MFSLDPIQVLVPGIGVFVLASPLLDATRRLLEKHNLSISLHVGHSTPEHETETTEGVVAQLACGTNFHFADTARSRRDFGSCPPVEKEGGFPACVCGTNFHFVDTARSRRDFGSCPPVEKEGGFPSLRVWDQLSFR